MKQAILWTLALVALALGIWWLARPGALPASEPTAAGAIEAYGWTAQETIRQAQEAREGSEERAQAVDRGIGKAQGRPVATDRDDGGKD